MLDVEDIFPGVVGVLVVTDRKKTKSWRGRGRGDNGVVGEGEVEEVCLRTSKKFEIGVALE